MYPPTSLVLFFPGAFALLVGIPTAVVYTAEVMLFGVAACLSTVLFYETVGGGVEFRVLAGLFAGPMFLWAGLNGFFDPIVAGIVLLAL